MARLYSNENFPQPVVEELRRLGHDVLTVLETGRSEQAWPDDALLDFATNLDRAVLTLNRKHFIRLHKEGRKHAGIIACTLDRDFKGQAERIDAAIREHGELKGTVVRVNRPNPA